MHPTRTLLALLLCFSSLGLQAAPSPEANAEINALLNFVEHSDCRFIRNGSEYSGSAASAHLQKKLEYLENKGLVDSAEDFIDRAASKSSMSGKPYQVSCPDGKQDASTWLNSELKRLRRAQ